MIIGGGRGGRGGTPFGSVFRRREEKATGDVDSEMVEEKVEKRKRKEGS